MSARLQPEQQQKRQPGREHEMRPQPDYEPKYPGCGKLKGRVALITDRRGVMHRGYEGRPCPR